MVTAEANKHDFRGYYGMGHTYEILRMPYFALYYYKQAHRLRSVRWVVVFRGYCRVKI